jgi:hypothetical protein
VTASVHEIRQPLLGNQFEYTVRGKSLDERVTEVTQILCARISDPSLILKEYSRSSA